MSESIVLAVDGGSASDAAVRWVAARAGVHDITVDVSTVIPLDESMVNRSRFTRALLSARKELARTRARQLEHVRHGDAVDALVAASRDADLLVVGTNRTSGLASLLHSTLALRLAGKAECPLVVVPANWSSDREHGSIVVGWEDDGSSDAAVEFAANEAAAAGRDLRVVHSWVLPPVDALDPRGSAALFASVFQGERSQLDNEVRRVRARHPSIEIHSALSPDSADTALDTMGEEAALLVIGSHGRGAIGDLLLGSVGDDLIRKMTCPVAIVPTGES